MDPKARAAAVGACLSILVAGASGCGGGDGRTSTGSGASGAGGGSSGPSGSGGRSGGASAGGGGSTSASTGASGGGGSGGHSYATQFPHTEAPISEGGKWIGGHAAGQTCGGGFCWGDVQTTPGLAFGTDEPTQFGDPTAILVGTWGASQTAMATVKAPVPAPSGGCCMEAEVRLRFSISQGMATGYEIYCSIMSSNQYCHVASWGGPDGAYVNLDAPQWDNNNPDCPGFPVTGPGYLQDGDVLSATVSGESPVTITGYINSVQFVTVVDKGQCHFNPPTSGPYGPWPAGAPGMGFYGNGFSSFGFTRFSASD